MDRWMGWDGMERDEIGLGLDVVGWDGWDRMECDRMGWDGVDGRMEGWRKGWVGGWTGWDGR